jgi:hypothetical protein
MACSTMLMVDDEGIWKEVFVAHFKALSSELLHWSGFSEEHYLNIIAFWDIAPCSSEVERRFRGAYCLHRQGEFFT